MFNFDRENMKKVMIIVAFGVILYWGLQNLELLGNAIGFIVKLIFPFILGLAIAFILNVIVNVLERRIFNKLKTKNIFFKFKRPISITLSILLLLLIIIFLVFLVVPELVRTVSMFAQNIPAVGENIKQWLENITTNYPDISNQIKNINLDWNAINDSIIEYAQTGLGAILNGSINFIMSTISGIVNFVVGFIFAIYILLQKETLIRQTKKLLYAYLPNKISNRIIHIASVTNKTFNNFATGQLTEAFILGLLCFIGMSIFGFPYALTISVLIGFTALIPFFGPLIGMLIGAILILVNSPTSAFWFIVFILILQQLEGNFIYPKVVGNSVGLPGIWVILAVTLGGSLFGILGMRIGVPIASILYTLLRKNVNQNISKKDIDINEYIDEDEESLNKTKFKKFSSKKKENKNSK